MKAKEFAEVLMKYPDYEVKAVYYVYGRCGDIDDEISSIVEDDLEINHDTKEIKLDTF